MILIHTRATDTTTIEIIRWVVIKKKHFLRLNTIHELFNPAFIPELGLEISIDNKSETFSSYYFNAGAIIIPEKFNSDLYVNNQFRQYLTSEVSALLCSLQENLPAYGFGRCTFRNQGFNKLTTLKAAQEFGFQIPETKIVNRKEAMVCCLKNWGRMITKSIDTNIDIQTEQFVIHGQRTEEVKLTDIAELDDKFMPTLIQKLIPKRYEIRTFWFRGKNKSIAIFSQLDKSSAIDFRVGNVNSNVRMVPYKLPEKIVDQLNMLMNSLGLNYGSIDFIMGEDGNVYFLEINPYGQYGFVSAAGNFHIERDISDHLN